MEIEVRLYAMFREYLPDGTKGFSFTRELPAESSLSDLFEALKLPPDMSKMVIIDGRITSEDYLLHDGDIVNIFPPIAGG